jgi:hypothetical protein
LYARPHFISRTRTCKIPTMLAVVHPHRTVIPISRPHRHIRAIVNRKLKKMETRKCI